MQSRKFPIGGMWPTHEWELQTNVACEALVYAGKTDDGAPCRHCVDVHDVETPNPGVPATVKRYWTCPSVVVGTDRCEGTSAGICLDCILDALAGAPRTSCVTSKNEPPQP